LTRLKHVGISSPSTSLADRISSLAEKLLSLDSPTRSKFVFLLTLAGHVQAQDLLLRRPGLPAELLSVMGHQSLASHVRQRQCQNLRRSDFSFFLHQESQLVVISICCLLFVLSLW